MKTRINEVAELLVESKNALDKIIVQIGNAGTNELHLQKFDEFDQELNKYVMLRIEAYELSSKS